MMMLHDFSRDLWFLIVNGLMKSLYEKMNEMIPNDPHHLMHPLYITEPDG